MGRFGKGGRRIRGRQRWRGGRQRQRKLIKHRIWRDETAEAVDINFDADRFANDSELVDEFEDIGKCTADILNSDIELPPLSIEDRKEAHSSVSGPPWFRVCRVPKAFNQFEPNRTRTEWGLGKPKPQPISTFSDTLVRCTPAIGHCIHYHSPRALSELIWMAFYYLQIEPNQSDTDHSFWNTNPIRIRYEKSAINPLLCNQSIN
jgi:hypothetical protein